MHLRREKQRRGKRIGRYRDKDSGMNVFAPHTHTQIQQRHCSSDSITSTFSDGLFLKNAFEALFPSTTTAHIMAPSSCWVEGEGEEGEGVEREVERARVEGGE